MKSGDQWRFDTASGKDELLARRIGRNELYAIKVLQAIVDAEQEYASEARTGDGVLAYAQRCESTRQARWAVLARESVSRRALGVLVAQAAARAYKQSDKTPPLTTATSTGC